MTSPARRVALLDSGLGGLTVLSALRALTLDTDYMYFADTAHVPYGGRELADVAALGAAIVKRLLVHDPSVIVVASGTTCAAFDAAGWPVSTVPLVGVVSFGALAAAAATRNGGIGVIATHATVRSGVFEREILKYRPDARVTSVAAPSLVPIVESGGWASVRARDAVALYCGPILRAGCDTLVLGCTHFQHLAAWFTTALGDEVAIVDPAAACAAKVSQMIAGLDHSRGTLSFEVSGDKDEFAANAQLLTGTRIDVLRHVDLKPSGTT
ncbi:MAG TPA: glutamate racemase [Candidatus Eremiobacteraceae bacterium]|nr:glutamate racemase [Candidatus Eremiobacteraceae bacterium]